MHVCGICRFCTMAHRYKYDFTIQIFINTYPFSISLNTIHFASYSNLQDTWKILRLAVKEFQIFCFAQSINHQLKVKKKTIVTILWSSKVLQGRGMSVFKFQNVSCVSLQSKDLVSISTEFQLLGHTKALSKRIIDQYEMKMVIPFFLFSGFIVDFFMGFKNGASFQKRV